MRALAAQLSALLACALLSCGCVLALAYPRIPPEVCDNLTDDDFDDAIDCDDDDCDVVTLCNERGDSCANTVDDDGDGLVDCGDPGCAPACGELGVNCVNRVDDDEDGSLDHVDPDCWPTARVAFDRCAQSPGGTARLGCVLGVDWVADVESGLGAPRQETTAFGPALVAPSNGTAAAVSVGLPGGALAGTRVVVEVVLGLQSPADTTPSAIDLSLGTLETGALVVHLSTFVDVAGASRFRISAGDEIVESNVVTTAVLIELIITLAADGAATIAYGDPIRSLHVVPETRWIDGQRLDLSFRAEDGAGVRSATVTRSPSERCGHPIPDVVLGPEHLQSAAWSSSGEVCLATARRAWAGRSADLRSLDRLSVIGEWPGDEVLVAMTWDERDHVFRGVMQPGDGTISTGPPRLVFAATCGTSWTDAGPAYTEDPASLATVRGLVLSASGSTMYAWSIDPPELLVARGDARTSRSFEVVERIALPAAGSSIADVAGHSVVITSDVTRAMHVVPLGRPPCVTADCGVLVLAPSGETDAFDRYGVPYEDAPDAPRAFALAMQPVTSESTSTTGLLFYEGCADPACASSAIGVGWLRISSRF